LTLNNKKIIKFSINLFLYSVLILLFCNSVCFAAETLSEGEKLYYSIMLWVNFGILVFLFIKFAKKPLMNFLRGQGDQISEQLQAIEADVKKAKSLLDEESTKLRSIDGNLEKITENILAVGAREKDSIIEKAKNLADKMVEDAKKEATFKIEAAKKRFSEEMLDLAVSITIEKIKNNLTDEDDENLVLSFSSGLNAE